MVPSVSSADDTKKTKPGKTRATVLRVVKEVANAADPRPSRKIPTADEWEPFVKRGLVYMSVFYVWWLTTDDDGNTVDTSAYELDDERAGIIASPFARLWARTPLNRRYGRDLIENMDSVVALVALVTYVMDTRPLWRARQARVERRKQNSNVIPMHSAQNTTARREPQPLQATAPAQPPPPAQPTKTNGGEQPNEQESERTATSPFKSQLGWTPGEQNRAD